MSDGNTTDDEYDRTNSVGTPLCGSTDTADGSPCELPVVDGGTCRLHDPDRGPTSDHGAPQGNTNAMTHGMYVDAKDALSAFPFSHEVLGIQLYERFMEESAYDFEPEYIERIYEPSELPEWIPEHMTDSEGRFFLEIPEPTKHEERALYLKEVAVNEIKAVRINAVLVECNMMKEIIVGSKYLEERGEWAKVTEAKEHYLNLVYDRLLRSKDELLKLGGVENPG